MHVKERREKLRQTVDMPDDRRGGGLRCTGIAGSTTIGRNCKIGGAAMIIGHLDIADGTTISASTGVFESIRTPGVYTSAFPALPHREWQYVASVLRRLRSFATRVRTLERSLENKAGEKGE